MGYRETLEWLFSLENMGIKFGLDNTRELLRRLGDPHLQFRSAHVAGTNGKGSVCAMASSILQEAGYRVGLYTSPHIVDFRERIQINGIHITERELLRLVDEIRPHVEEMAAEGPDRRLTFFEITTALAFAHFADKGAEETVIEVGMGGRLDATNVIVPDCSVITRISLEHTKYLGETLGKIAFEKAGVIKPGVPVVVAEGSQEVLGVFQSIASERKASLRIVREEEDFRLASTSIEGTRVFLSDLEREVSVPLIGSFQAMNAALACACSCELRKRGLEVSFENIANGLSKAKWPGRIEVLSRKPLVLLDATHTSDGAAFVAKDVARLAKGKIVLVLGVLDDKDLEGISRHLGPIASLAIATAPRSKRAFPPETVAASLRNYCDEVELVTGVGEAVGRALSAAAAVDTVLITGSLYTIGEARIWWEAHEAGKEDNRVDRRAVS